ncbi:SAM-dependent methyltransferase [Tahibacter amnicola]|uniref:SAM-dependent methyltransferase n=1 Tax=Tahibacter amnicola TaxID=2976241 RepID=A0ABY6BG61_9GAMM|nr:SAM-dependent methyltransferase [Tahibacter amnicola]UXI68278.1 SAM-dependent methyltransferase [Tahibacter amnicola]
MPQGKLVCVGIGMTLGSHIGPLAKSHITQADVVFAGVSDSVVEAWLRTLHPDVRSLQPFYEAGKSRRLTYREMVEAMLAPVRAGQSVCGAFYGHPGVFAWAPHRAIALARSEGHEALMVPGVSAEDCLYADLGIDPGRVGCQHYEASQFMLYRRTIDSSAYLVLWQVGLAGDRSLTRTSTGPAYRQLLVELLLEHYPADHPVVIYRAPTLPVVAPRMDSVRLCELPAAPIDAEDTVVIAPVRPLEPRRAIRAQLAALDMTLVPGD